MAMTFEEVVAAAKALPIVERRQLVDTLADGLDSERSDDSAGHRLSWLDLRGALPYPACGEDAQEYISRTRREDTEHRDRLLGRLE